MKIIPLEYLPPKLTLSISYLWGSSNALSKSLGECTLSWSSEGLHLNVSAQYFHNDPPPYPIGPVWKLWEWEVFEVFIVGINNQYLEIELSPHGHYLVLKLNQVRMIQEKLLPIEYQSSIQKDCWQGQAIIPFHLLPPAYINAQQEYDYHINMFMHTLQQPHQYSLAYPLGEGTADFHRIHSYPSWRSLETSHQ